MATPAQQIRAARAMLQWTQADLAQRANISIPRIVAIEAGENCLRSTADAIVTALEQGGAVFEPGGAVNVIQKSEKFIVESRQNSDAATLREAKRIVNAGRRARNLPELS